MYQGGARGITVVVQLPVRDCSDSVLSLSCNSVASVSRTAKMAWRWVNSCNTTEEGVGGGWGEVYKTSLEIG